VIAVIELDGYTLTKIGRAIGVLQGVLFHVTPSVSVGDADGNVLQDWPCAYSAEEFVCGGIEQPVLWAMDLIWHF
jgi:hypothetical protein